MRYLNKENGSVKPVLCLVILALAVYSGFQFGMPYYKYSAFNSEVKDITRLAAIDAEKVRFNVLAASRSLRIPIEEKDITIIKKDSTVRVKASWTVTVDILGLYQKALYFKVDVEE